MQQMAWSLAGESSQTLFLGMGGIALALIALGVLIHAAERSTFRHATRHAPRTGQSHVAQPVRRARHAHLSGSDLARLSAFRGRARLMAGEPLGDVRWWRKVAVAWRDGYAGWVIACAVGSFSMATHFGAWWLISGGGWGGAAVVTVLSTVLMAGTCAWIGLGLISGR